MASLDSLFIGCGVSHTKFMIREYLKLARSFNVVFTGLAPVIGAIAMGEFNVSMLFLLFLVGFWGHTFGFVYNDIHDYPIDKSSKEISDRPLVSGTISIGQAWVFAVLAVVSALIVSLIVGVLTHQFYPIIILAVAAGFIILYDVIGKKYPFTDVFVSLGVFFLILYGASTTVPNLTLISPLAWIVCTLGGIQVFFMQVAGGIKDIENDSLRGVRTMAVRLGVRVTDGRLHVSSSYKVIAYGIQVLDIIVVFLPFFIIWNARGLTPWELGQWAVLFCLGVVMLLLSHRLLSMSVFERGRARMLIGSHYMVNFAMVPIMLMSLNLTTWVLVFLPGIGFLLSNLMLHGTLLQPKTM